MMSQFQDDVAREAEIKRLRSALIEITECYSDRFLGIRVRCLKDGITLLRPYEIATAALDE